MNSFNVIIPARMDSTRLPKKMVQLIGDVPLIVVTAKQALKSGAASVVVATDHSEIFDICKTHKIDVIMTSKHHQSGTERLYEAVNILELADNEIVINIQGDEPFVPPELINELAGFMAHKGMATIAHPIFSEEEIFNPSIVKVVLDYQSDALYFSRSPIPFYRDGFKPDSFNTPKELPILRHIGIYGYSAGFIREYVQFEPSPIEKVESLEQLRPLYHGHKIAVLVSHLIPEGGIDTLEDLERAKKKILEGHIKIVY